MSTGLIVILLLAVGVAIYYPRGPHIPSSCRSIIGKDTAVALKDYSYTCGDDEASDGRLAITYHNYHFAEVQDLDLIYQPGEQHLDNDEVFMLVNVTVTNVGGGNTSIGGGWNAWVLNGSSWVANTDFFVNASFPNTYPDEVIPDINGGLYLPPGATANLWILFYVPFGLDLKPTDINQTATWQLQYITFNDQNYGGTYRGGGAYNCQKVACTDPMTELIVRT